MTQTSKDDSNTEAFANAARSFVVAASEQMQDASITELRNLHSLTLKHLPPISESLERMSKRMDTLLATQKKILAQNEEEARIRSLQWAAKNVGDLLEEDELDSWRDEEEHSGAGVLQCILLAFIRNSGINLEGHTGETGTEEEFQQRVVEKIHSLTGRKPVMRGNSIHQK